jgi:hypothetical protein
MRMPERLGRVRDLLENAERLGRQPVFLSPQDAPAIETALVRFWRNKGLELTFATAGP